MLSFLGSLNYYSRLIEDFAIYASVLYELREADFYEISRDYDGLGVYSAGGDQDDSNRIKAGGDQDGRKNRWEKAVISFMLLKVKIANTPILKHFDPDRQPVIVVHASKWAISAALLQEYDGVFWPVIFTTCTLKTNEINYGVVEKEVLRASKCGEVDIISQAHVHFLSRL